MSLTKMFSNSWFQAIFLVVVLWGLGNIGFRFASVLEVNFMIFTCCLFLSSSFILLVLGGKGDLGKETMRSVDTWVYGIVLLLLYVLNLYLFGMVTSTEATLLQRMSIVVSMVLSWLFLGRKSNLLQMSGGMVVLVGVLMICSGVPQENKSTLYAIIIASGFLQALQIFSAEFHRPHKHAVKIKQNSNAKFRVVGFVMFVSSTLFLSIMLLMALTQGINAEENTILKDFPVLKDFMHPPSILFGMIMGVIITAPTKILEFSSAHKINTQNFLAVCCLAPAATLFWEWSTAPLTGLSLREFSNLDIISGIAITFGGLVIAIGSIKKMNKAEKWEEYISYSVQDITRIEDSREIVANTLEHFHNNIKESAKALNISAEVVNILLNDKDKVLAFNKDTLKEVSHHYIHSVASADPLTGLPNRAAFMIELRNNSYDGNTYSVLFIDLDKFKPVNDTHGHEAGDTVLKGIAERLQKIAPKGSIVTRLGGDEFCILLPKLCGSKAKQYIEEIKLLIAKPFNIEDKTINVSASIGIASYPKDSTYPEELLKIADTGMYDEKS